MNPFSAPFTPDPDAKRKGKIAHLPRPFREKTNQLLYEGQTAVQIAQWLNEIPAIKTILANHFGGRPINSQNLTEWKQGGYRDWLRHQQLLEQTGDLAANAGELAQAADGLADSLFGLLTIDYTQTLMHRDEQSPEEFEKQRKNLSLLAQDIVRLRRCHLNARRVELQEQRYDQTQEKTGEQLFQLFLQWADNPAIQKAFLLGPAQRHGRLRELFGLPPKPQRDSRGRLVLSPEPQNHPDVKPPGQIQTEFKPIQAKKTASSSSKNENATTPPSSCRSRGDEALTSSSSSSSSKNENAALAPDANSAGETACPPPAPLQPPINEPPHGIPVPQITPGKTTAQLIAEIEDYAVQVALERRARSKSSCRSRGDEALTSSSSSSSSFSSSKNENAALPRDASSPDSADTNPSASQLPASPKPLGEGRSTHPTLNPQPPKPPLSDYDKALLEGKSHLEALYAQFTPTPEEFARRKRANEELRRQSAETQAQPPSWLQSGFADPHAIPSSKFYGPCPSPYTWQGPRPLDPWKVHTS